MTTSFKHGYGSKEKKLRTFSVKKNTTTTTTTLELIAICNMEGFLPQGYQGFNSFPVGKLRETNNLKLEFAVISLPAAALH